ncbi:MAG: hypothetical protein J1F35_06305 [Erysipelotrichales bacterium]|nr:hypothetical protein [Erysipelotrichales bacterium]
MATFGSIRKSSLIYIVNVFNKEGRTPNINRFYVEKVKMSSDNKVVIRLANGWVRFNPNASSAIVRWDDYTQHVFTEREKAEAYYLSLQK